MKTPAAVNSAVSYVIHTAAGQILSYGECAPQVLALQPVPQGCTLLKHATGHWNTHYVAQGQLVTKPARPSEDHQFNYHTKQWELDATQALARLRAQRAALLAASDWTDTLSAKARLGDALYAKWQAYRQALRDLPQQASPEDVFWPEPPTTSK